MTNKTNSDQPDSIDHLYAESGHWHVNTGGETIHAKRMPGKYRRIKWITSSVWLVFFLGPYLRWNGQQAVLLDIPGRKFHIFDITILPQDVWLLALVLLFFAILLAAVTSVAGRVFCGYFCFQTIWTDIFTLIETKLEGSPAQRQRLDKATWDAHKVRVKLIKHTLWILIGLITGISFCAWFTDAYQLWPNLFALNVHISVWISLSTFTFATYLFAGFMREQVCFWLCPYARIQGVMYDAETILPTYDFRRGEPRGKLKRTTENSAKGDCIDCNLCVGVCPTGIDIRNGQQEGCITCALCLDACDSVMDKIQRPRGLIRYASLDEINGKAAIPLIKRPRVLIYFSIMLLSIAGIIYGLTHLGSLELKVLHERQPLYVVRSDGSIQNKYELKILNKTDQPMRISLAVRGPEQLQLVDADQPLTVQPYSLLANVVFLRIAANTATAESTAVTFIATGVDDPSIHDEYQSMFIAPMTRGQ
ncbi:MAG: cytochrome c oxidase accessory protein CcoG [Gammaproteobacteria bacterium]|nr:cytochrome c oxidase accessory protein CcoG [Gammaproteobacteria bacterium]